MDIPARPSRRGLVSSSIGRGAGANGIRPTCTGAERRRSTCPPASFLYRSVGANGIRLTCAEGGRGRPTCPPASLFYRSRGRGECHSPYVYRGRNGIRTATDATERGPPTGLFFGISPLGSRLHFLPHGESESFLATPIQFELEPVSLKVLSADSPHVYSLLGLLVK